jgi:RNA polymerase sigma-70 factor (ECF subfamily)
MGGVTNITAMSPCTQLRAGGQTFLAHNADPGQSFGLLYAELHKLARAAMRRERPGHTLQPTALINEAYLRLTAHREESWESRAHFFGAAARAMRQILIDHARRRHRAKHGGMKVELHDSDAIFEANPEEVMALEAALDELGGIDQRSLRIVELRYFVGLSVEETAKLVGLSPKTVNRDWEFARVWLESRLRSDSRHIQ